MQADEQRRSLLHSFPCAEKNVFFFMKGNEAHEKRRSGADPLRMRDRGSHIQGRAEVIGRENRRRHEADARSQQTAWAAAFRLRHLSGIPGFLRAASVFSTTEQREKNCEAF
jgi:hypothetical protein